MNNRTDVMSACKDRRLFAIDIENAVGTGKLDERKVAYAMNKIAKLHSLTDNDLVIVGISHKRNAFPVGSQLPGIRIVFHPGKNGADLAIKDVLAKERIPERFTEIILVSGDGIFAEDVERLRAAGTRVNVTARKGNLSQKLAMKATRVLYPKIKRAA